MKKDLLIEVENVEPTEPGLVIRTLSKTKFEDKVLVSLPSGDKIIVTLVELQEALDELAAFQDSMEHPLDRDVEKLKDISGFNDDLKNLD